jgi:hypothetical protein
MRKEKFFLTITDQRGRNHRKSNNSQRGNTVSLLTCDDTIVPDAGAYSPVRSYGSPFLGLGLIVLVLLRDRRVGVAEIREGLQETLGHGLEPVVADLNTPLGSRDDGLDGVRRGTQETSHVLFTRLGPIHICETQT